MIVRRVDNLGDWTFGRGRGNYLAAGAAVTQNIATRLRSFVGECFFDAAAGIDWFNLLGAKDQTALNLAIAATILNTEGVIQLQRLAVTLDVARNITVQYQVITTYSSASATLQISSNG